MTQPPMNADKIKNRIRQDLQEKTSNQYIPWMARPNLVKPVHFSEFVGVNRRLSAVN